MPSLLSHLGIWLEADWPTGGGCVCLQGQQKDRGCKAAFGDTSCVALPFPSPSIFQHPCSVQTISVMWVRPRVLPAPGDLLRRDDAGLFAVLWGVAARLWFDFSTRHSGETEHTVGVRGVCNNLPPTTNLSE